MVRVISSERAEQWRRERMSSRAISRWKPATPHHHHQHHRPNPSSNTHPARYRYASPSLPRYPRSPSRARSGVSRRLHDLRRRRHIAAASRPRTTTTTIVVTRLLLPSTSRVSLRRVIMLIGWLLATIILVVFVVVSISSRSSRRPMASSSSTSSSTSAVADYMEPFPSRTTFDDTADASAPPSTTSTDDAAAASTPKEIPADKRVCVIVGASSGIGAAIATLLSSESHVYANGAVTRLSPT